MLFLLVYNILSTRSLLALGIWAGKETIGSRVLAQAKTWMRFWNDIYVFTDKIPKAESEEVQKAAFPCNIHFVELKNYSDHLEDTEWTNRWYFAQPRFLPAIEKLSQLEPNVSWYVFGDDDTYFFREPLVRKLSSFVADRPYVIGKVWCSNAQFSDILKSNPQCLPFAQGGAGIALSRAYMKKISPHLLECNRQFNHPDFPGSMRLAFCSARLFGEDEWSVDDIVVPWPEGFHADPPEKEIQFGTVSESPASFHRIFENKTKGIAITHTANFVDQNGRNYIIDLSEIAFTKVLLPLGSLSTRFQWWIGHMISFDSVLEPFLKPKGEWEAKVSTNSTLLSITQQYERDVKITLICDNKYSRRPRFYKFLDEEGSHPSFKVSCQRMNIVMLD